MSECVFCNIVAGVAPATILKEWTDTIAIVPLNPVTVGHALVLPKLHVPQASHDPIVTGVTFARAAQLALGASVWPYNLITSAGKGATQTVFHLHVHLVPRRKGDGLMLPWTDQEPRVCTIDPECKLDPAKHNHVGGMVTSRSSQDDA